MGIEKNRPSPARFWTWFNPVGRQTGDWAFILNRITALGLIFYLFLHLIILSTLANGTDGYDNFLKLIKSPVFTFGELLVVAAGFFHGLNGVRIILTTFGVGVTRQKQLFYGLMAVAVILTAIIGIRMFTA